MDFPQGKKILFVAALLATYPNRAASRSIERSRMRLTLKVADQIATGAIRSSPPWPCSGAIRMQARQRWPMRWLPQKYPRPAAGAHCNPACCHDPAHCRTRVAALITTPDSPKPPCRRGPD